MSSKGNKRRVEVEIGSLYDDNVHDSKDQVIHLVFYGAQLVNGEVISVVHDHVNR